MRKLAFVGVIVAVLATAATGQEAVEIKVYQPKVGDRLKVMIEEKTETKTYERMPFKRAKPPPQRPGPSCMSMRSWRARTILPGPRN